MPKYPNVKVQLSQHDGNSFAILARVRAAMKKANIASDEVEEFTSEAASGDYDHLLQTVMEWVDWS